MKRGYLLIVVAFGIAAAAFGQATSPEPQALQALLSEVRGLRQDLRAALAQVHSSQILMARLQVQQAAVTRASQHLDEARSKLAEVQVAVRGETNRIKYIEDATPDAQRTQAQLEEALSQAKADLDVSKNLEQQRQAVETEAEQELRVEQDKLTSLESQLDDLVRALNNPGA